jgi:hypothetical protein
MGKGKSHYIEVVFDEEDGINDEGIGQESGEPSHDIEKKPLQDSTNGMTLSTLSRVPKYYTFKVRGIL